MQSRPVGAELYHADRPWQMIFQQFYEIRHISWLTLLGAEVLTGSVESRKYYVLLSLAFSTAFIPTYVTYFTDSEKTPDES